MSSTIVPTTDPLRSLLQKIANMCTPDGREITKTYWGVRQTLVLRTGSSFDIHKQILHGEVEVGLAVRTPDSKHLDWEVCGIHQFVAFVHPNHPYARNGELTPAELASGPLVLRGGTRLQSGAETELMLLGRKPNVAVRCETLEAVRSAVRNKLGIGILSYDTVKNAIERGEFRLLRVPELALRATSFIIYHKERPLSSNATEFLTLLRNNRPTPELPRNSRDRDENSLGLQDREKKRWVSGQAKLSCILTAAIQLGLSQTDFWPIGWL